MDTCGWGNLCKWSLILLFLYSDHPCPFSISSLFELSIALVKFFTFWIIYTNPQMVLDKTFNCQCFPLCQLGKVRLALGWTKASAVLYALRREKSSGPADFGGTG